MIADVAVSAAIYAIDKPYSYIVPDEMTLTPGMRVRLPFGSGNRCTEGIILRLRDGTDDSLKKIQFVLDDTPVLSGQMLRLAAFLRERYFCTYYDAIRAILPTGLWFSESETYTLIDPLPDDWMQMIRRKPDASRFVSCLLELGGSASEKTLLSVLSDDFPLTDIARYLYNKKLLSSSSTVRRKVNDRMDLFIRLETTTEEAMSYAIRKRKTAPMQYAVIELLCAMGSGCAKDILYFTGASMATLKRLEQLCIVSFFRCEVLRRAKISPVSHGEPIYLNYEQAYAYSGLLRMMYQPDPGVALLYGVTGSGKTAVYIELIKKCIELGKQAILLVPEIALTPQLLSQMAAYFNDQIAVLHSSLRIGERYDEWKRIKSGQAQLVIGTRSAVFAPVQNLGLIILDEEHEHTYKSENTPYYHAREVAIYRGAKEKALVLLGSATPSVESMYRARTGIYQLFQLTQRYNGASLPQVIIMDMKREIREGNGNPISRELLSKMKEEKSKGKKTILFLNRRGTSRMVVCVECGFVPQCPRCSVHLTFHSANRRIMCHYCGYSEPAIGRCPHCGGKMKHLGFGTQRVQEALMLEAPELISLRMDADTVSAANPHEKILSRFEKENIDVLIGTQMVTKGLNFEDATLVGVLDADAALYIDHYRASENAFSMMTQVIGRAGRFRDPGTAIIQTMTPENEIIKLAAQQNYDAFYEKEIELRRLQFCPPFCDLITIKISGKEEQRVVDSAITLRNAFEDALRIPEYSSLNLRVLGPAPAPITRINNTYHYRLTLCGENSRMLRGLVAFYLQQFPKDKRNKGVFVIADVNSLD